MRISMIGAGAVGKAYGGLLSLANHEVHYLMRSEFMAIQSAQHFNLNFVEQNKILKIDKPQIVQASNQLPASDLIIITLKTTDNNNISKLLETCLTDKSVVLIIQNGIGNEEWISQWTKESPVLTGISYVGATRENALNVVVAFLGELRLAPFQRQHRAQCEKIAALFQEACVSTQIYDNYKEIRWLKLLWNVPFAALSVIYNKDAASLATRQPYASIVTSLIEEVCEVATSEGIAVSQDYIAKMLERTKKMQNYYPSMYHDFVQGKPIEKEYIIDNVLVIARKNDIKTPMLNLIASHLTKEM